MAIGGFNGTDPTPTLAQFEAYVAQGRIHYFIGGGVGPGGGSGTSSAIAQWVEQHFTAKPRRRRDRLRPHAAGGLRRALAIRPGCGGRRIEVDTCIGDALRGGRMRAPAFATYQSPKFPSGSDAFMYSRLSPVGDQDGELHRQLGTTTCGALSLVPSSVATSMSALWPRSHTIATVTPSAATAGAPQSCAGVVSDTIALRGPVCRPSTETTVPLPVFAKLEYRTLPSGSGTGSMSPPVYASGTDQRVPPPMPLSPIVIWPSIGADHSEKSTS